MATYADERMLFHYERRFSEALKRGQVYFPGEHVKKFGLQIGNIEPVPVGDKDTRFQWGEVIKLDSDGRAEHIEDGDSADDFYGVVSRNATGTMGVLEEQVMGLAPRNTLSVFRGGREGEISVPVQDEHDTPVEKGGKVYVRIAESDDNPDLPLGGIETEEITDETVEWEGVTFAGEATNPYTNTDDKFTDEDGPTNVVAPIELD